MAINIESIERIEQALIENVIGVQNASVDGMAVQAKNARELIEALEYLKTEESGSTVNSSRGLRITKLIPPGTG